MNESVVVLAQVLKLISTNHFSILHSGRHFVHLELVLEAKLLLEVYEVTEEHPLAVVIEGAEYLGHLRSKCICWYRRHRVPDHSERE